MWESVPSDSISLIVLAIVVFVLATGRAAGSDADSQAPEGEAPAQAGESALQSLSDVEYAVRHFEPVGSATLTVGGEEYSFSVAECHLADRTLSNDRIQDVYVLGAGEADGRAFFVEIRRSRDARDRSPNVGLSLHFAPLPAVYAHEMPTTNEVLQMMQQLQSADSLRSIGVGAVTYDDLTVGYTGVETTRKVAFMRFSGGGLDGPVGHGTLSVDCAG